jgi:hypothetical protein
MSKSGEMLPASVDEPFSLVSQQSYGLERHGQNTSHFDCNK